MQGATQITQTTTDQLPGQPGDPVEAFAAMTLENSNTPEHHAILAEAVEDAPAPPHQIVAPTNPEATPKSHGPKTATEEFVAMKYNLQGVILSMERIGIALVEANQLSAQEASVESIKQSINDLLHTDKDLPARNPFRARAPKTGGRKFPRPYPFRKTWSNKLLEPFNLTPLESFDKVELKEGTLKCMEADGLSIEPPGYVAKNIISPLVNVGNDATLQLRGNKLQNFVFYAIVDVLDGASPEAQIVILVNRVSVRSSQMLAESLKAHLDHAELKVDLHVVPEDKTLDLAPLTKSTPNKPTVFVSAPSTFTRMKDAGVILPKNVQILAVYEAEYVLQTNSNIEMIKTALADFDVCQVILACQHGTTDVIKAEEQFNFTDERITFSEDNANLHLSHHKYFVGNGKTDEYLKHAVGLGKTQTVVVVCHDGQDAAKMREQLKDDVELLVTSRASDAKAETGGVVGGLFVTSLSSAQVLESTPHTPVRWILNLAGTTLTIDGYLRMLGTYMDIGEECTVLSKVGSPSTLKELEEFGVEFEESYQRAGQSISDNQLEQLQGQLDTFRSNLENFARNHRKDIQKDPVFRMHFQKMCGNIGVDPLASSKGVWGELLGVGDFYYELGIQIIDVCLSTRALNGGLMELSEVQRRVERMRGVRDPTSATNKPLPNIPYNSNSHINNLANKWATMTNKDSNGMEVTEDDVLRSIKTLAPLGSGFQVLQIGEKKMVSSVPRELNRDQSIVLGLVQKTNGHVNINVVGERLGWESGRAKTALDTLLNDSLMWIDQQAEPHEYWVPGFFEPEDDDIYASTATGA
ncbi:ESCRT-II subunit protein snf8 [Linnemannia hyalina]|uniref:ESCRT-II subunit protein snf8 n=1 Tax=Linnemannia hyalina TaxID=64524 RepID=A0A9P7XSE0_9FUNG|nr:ESCRT-II subunit protein snf8 [Linnemannia hyalina]